MDGSTRISLIPKINYLWDEVKVLEELIDVSSTLDPEATMILIQDYREVVSDLAATLDEYFEYEEAYNLPTNLRLRKLRKELKSA